MTEIAIIILAAGKSLRMRGRDKLTERINGIAQIRRITMAACKAFSRVFITVPELTHPRVSFLLGLEVRIIPVGEVNFGMGSSIAAAIDEIQQKEIQGAMIVPADMPELTQMDLKTVATAFESSPEAIIQAITPNGKKGHPVVFPRSTFENLKTLSGDEGARSILRTYPSLLQYVTLPFSHAETDLDTPEEWHEWLSDFK